MKKSLMGWFLVLVVSKAAFASTVALVYESEKNVMEGKSVLGTVVEGGIVIPADSIASPKSLFFAAPSDQALRSASLVRMDIQLNTAFLSLGAAVTTPALLEAHRKRAAALTSFLPAATSGESATLAPVLEVPEGPFQLKINGQLVGTEPVILKKGLKKSKFKLDVVMVSSATAWSVDVDLESEPRLAFWKEGRKSGGLNDVPQEKFHYGQQVFFRPLSANKSLQVPIEVFFIDGEDYVFTFRVSSKELKMEQKVPVKFTKRK